MKRKPSKFSFFTFRFRFLVLSTAFSAQRFPRLNSVERFPSVLIFLSPDSNRDFSRPNYERWKKSLRGFDLVLLRFHIRDFILEKVFFIVMLVDQPVAKNFVRQTFDTGQTFPSFRCSIGNLFNGELIAVDKILIRGNGREMFSNDGERKTRNYRRIRCEVCLLTERKRLAEGQFGRRH